MNIPTNPIFTSVTDPDYKRDIEIERSMPVTKNQTMNSEIKGCEGGAAPHWPNCKELQCAQAHEVLNCILEILNIPCDDSIYVVGKMIRIVDAIGQLKVNVAVSRREAFEQKAISDAYRDKLNDLNHSAQTKEGCDL